MARLLFLLRFLSSLGIASSFTATLSLPRTATAISKPLSMFSAEDGKISAEKSQGLAEIMPGESADALKDTTTLQASTRKPRMQVLNRNTGEMMDVEMNESFLANEKFEIEWWAWIGFVAFPVTLLSNDVFHFLPTDGPLGFLAGI